MAPGDAFGLAARSGRIVDGGKIVSTESQGEPSAGPGQVVQYLTGNSRERHARACPAMSLLEMTAQAPASDRITDGPLPGSRHQARRKHDRPQAHQALRQEETHWQSAGGRSDPGCPSVAPEVMASIRLTKTANSAYVTDIAVSWDHKPRREPVNDCVEAVDDRAFRGRSSF
jgi:hypothetical protein